MSGEFGLEIGDWVLGKSRNGELIRGYIEKIDILQGAVKVFVIESDNEKTIGKRIGMLHNWVEKLPVSTKVNDGQTLDLIDLALLTRDEQWFIDLSEKLNAHETASKVMTKKNNLYPIRRNRIRNSNSGR
ncbi:IDEAL domain-containing protein [Peribacillus cavernae]|uniref:IDEAL domain-containing protein n=2 Tax=Peribacillus cavernae TaxID=1674310 RepID=A0A3S0TYU9_9BACI|nr:IDEAL domain-containing protein [Peribacillus cavernae]